MEIGSCNEKPKVNMTSLRAVSRTEWLDSEPATIFQSPGWGLGTFNTYVANIQLNFMNTCSTSTYLQIVQIQHRFGEYVIIVLRIENRDVWFQSGYADFKFFQILIDCYVERMRFGGG